MGDFPEPREGTVFYKDGTVYACLAFEPKVQGHTIVAWIEDVADISELSRDDYHHLMDVVNWIRAALIKVYHTDHVYMCYLNEADHVHWHLFPRTGEIKGFELMTQKGIKVAIDFEVIPRLKAALLR